MQNTTTQWRRRVTQFLEKYTSHFIWKVFMWEGVGDRTELQYIYPHSYGHQYCGFLVLKGYSAGGPGAHSAGCWLSLPHLVTNGSGLQTAWLPVFTELYNSSTPTFLWASQIELIQPIHGQGYNILIDRMHLFFTKVRFLFWQPGRVVGQYTTYCYEYYQENM